MNSYIALLFAAFDPGQEESMRRLADTPDHGHARMIILAVIVFMATTAAIYLYRTMVVQPRKVAKEWLQEEDEKWQATKEKTGQMLKGKKFLMVLRSIKGTRMNAESIIIDAFTQLGALIPVVTKKISDSIWENDFERISALEDDSYVILITATETFVPQLGETMGYDLRLMIKDSGRMRAIGAKIGRATSQKTLGKCIARKVADILGVKESGANTADMADISSSN